jgi:two-component system, OmpR family, phosphate regulon sensor histidine kinase PhoR
MPERQTGRLLLAAATVAAPGILALGGLVAFRFLAPMPALVAALLLTAFAALVAWRHLSGLALLRRRIDRLATHDTDLKVDAPTVPELSLALGRLARQWQEQKRRLTEASEAANRILEALSDPLIVVDGEGRVVRANHADEDAFQMRLVGRELTTGVRHPQLLNAVDSALGEGQSLAAEIAMPPPMSRNYSALVEPLGDNGKDGALIVLHDLTPVRMGERMRADFVANVSHELRTPLSSLLGFVETLRGPARDDPDAQEKFLAIMHDQAERMSRLIEDLLSLSRIEMDEHTRPRGTVDLGQMLGNVKDMLSMKASARGMRIALDIPRPLATLPGDSDQLTQVFQNLIDNALKYGRDGTAVEVGVALRDNEVAITVTDHGEGIPAEHLPRLTERFYRVDAARSRQLGGTGLGLAIVKHIVNRHRGHLSVDSRIGEGSRFTVTLPTTADPGARRPAPLR